MLLPLFVVYEKKNVKFITGRLPEYADRVLRTIRKFMRGDDGMERGGVYIYVCLIW